MHHWHVVRGRQRRVLAGLGLDEDDDRLAVGRHGTNHKVVIADVAAVDIKGRPRLNRGASDGDIAESGSLASAPTRSSRPDQAAASVGALVPGLRFLGSTWLSHAA